MDSTVLMHTHVAFLANIAAADPRFVRGEAAPPAPPPPPPPDSTAPPAPPAVSPADFFADAGLPVPHVQQPTQPAQSGKRYDSKAERLSLVTGRWEEVSLDGGQVNPQTLFTAVTKMWPKSPEYEGYDDVVELSLHSKPLIRVLRKDVSELKATEAVYDDKPAVNARDLFHAQDEILRVCKEKMKWVVEMLRGASATPQEPVDSAKAGEVAKEVDHLQVLLAWLDEEFGSTRSKLHRLLKPPSSLEGSSDKLSSSSASDGDATDGGKDDADFQPQISWKLLWAILKRGSLGVTDHELSGEKQAFKITSTAYMTSPDGPVFSLVGITRQWTGSKYKKTHVAARIPKFTGLRRLSHLPVMPPTPGSQLHEDLAKRGKLYCELTGDAGDGGIRFLNYSGALMYISGGGQERKVVRLRAEGRAIVDVKSFRRMNPLDSMREDRYDDDSFDAASYSQSLVEPWSRASRRSRHGPTAPPAAFDPSLDPSELCLLPPTVQGFSLVRPDWGELSVELFSPIEFRDQAWDLLVLDEKTKALVRGLVENNDAVRRARARNSKEKEAEAGTRTGEELVEQKPKVVADLIEGKGGGLVVALHGPPGTGKTLTAEAVAEGGGAVLLIDEADVFLEERQRTDVGRNAMVSVFLRMLEHHSGVLFLTTNRIRSIDEAFLSRFSLAITLPALDKSSRKLIYSHFLALAGVGIEGARESATAAPNDGKSNISAKYLDKIAGYAGFNGRQIKNIVRTAQSLALSQSAPLTETQLNVVIKTAQDFQRDLDEADEKGVYEAKGEGWKDRTSVFM
ncbi:hypothetical protein JCM8097_008316 [Rhodosporidiobolus ruineniae]